MWHAFFDELDHIPDPKDVALFCKNQLEQDFVLFLHFTIPYPQDYSQQVVQEFSSIFDKNSKITANQICCEVHRRWDKLHV